MRSVTGGAADAHQEVDGVAGQAGFGAVPGHQPQNLIVSFIVNLVD